ncbi:hypothetical protein AZO1586I_1605 [Bathymodiolus thermophilus thioautotrophic gill symbiont]|jgi:hypothetical protein|uniref:Uncharacterized protein n=1 Tax=Bathymodiolus thermophilus thioautotrophic gill symbiont TaxID=2360 RepID=A0ABM8M973_9GAMM|nr:hypothetical protein AZO1586I_1605 [Bathymodiolus thermophilus thioautotrophic gill symbiont]CAC9495837.1 hypothetical protein [uncultured Gammaproteobacteria bacterium]
MLIKQKITTKYFLSCNCVELSQDPCEFPFIKDTAVLCYVSIEKYDD